MFPIHESTGLLLVTLAVAAGAAVFVALRGWIGFWRAALIVVIGVGWPWPIAVYLGLDHYIIRAALYASGWTGLALFSGALWGVLVNRVFGSLPVVLMSLLPSVALSAYLLERQRVPDNACAMAVEFRIGDLRLNVPRSMGLRAIDNDSTPAKMWEGAYGESPSVKRDVRALCRISEGGRKPVDAEHVWLSFGWMRKELERECEAGELGTSQLSLCQAVAKPEPTVAQFYAGEHGAVLPSLGHFNSQQLAQARAEGQSAGYSCKDSTRGPQTRYCTVWLQLTEGVFAVSTVKLGSTEENEDPIADSIVLLEELLRRLHVE